MTASDIVYTILVYENTKEVWEEDLQIKARFRTDEERRNAMHHKKTKYHIGRGKHLKRFGDGWTDNGQEDYQIAQDLQGTQVKCGIHFKIIGNYIKRNITPEIIIKLRN